MACRPETRLPHTIWKAGCSAPRWGVDIYTQEARANGHYHHIDVINKVRACGSIPAFVEKYDIPGGIMRACVQKNVPFVLTGSIRDDGPLPEVYSDVYRGQDAMRALVRKATTVICVATQLHTIAVGNMTPSFRVVDGAVRPLFSTRWTSRNLRSINCVTGAAFRSRASSPTRRIFW